VNAQLPPPALQSSTVTRAPPTLGLSAVQLAARYARLPGRLRLAAGDNQSSAGSYASTGNPAPGNATCRYSDTVSTTTASHRSTRIFTNFGNIFVAGLNICLVNRLLKGEQPILILPV